MNQCEPTNVLTWVKKYNISPFMDKTSLLVQFFKYDPTSRPGMSGSTDNKETESSSGKMEEEETDSLPAISSGSESDDADREPQWVTFQTAAIIFPPVFGVK